MAIVVAGISHNGAALAVREKVAFRAAELLPILSAIRDDCRFREGVLLSTCNRTEFYIVEGERDTEVGWIEDVLIMAVADRGAK